MTRAEPWRSSSPLTSLQAPRGLSPVVRVLGPSGLCNRFDVFHPFHHHVFFSSPFCRMLLRSKNSKSTAPLTLISMPRCVLCCQDFSASFLQAVPSPGSPRFPLPLGFLTLVSASALACLPGSGKCSFQGRGFALKSNLILDGGCFLWNV